MKHIQELLIKAGTGLQEGLANHVRVVTLNRDGHESNNLMDQSVGVSHPGVGGVLGDAF